MRLRKYKKKPSLSFKVSKKYKMLDSKQITELIQNTKNLFESLESKEEASEKYKVFQSAISLIVQNIDNNNITE